MLVRDRTLPKTDYKGRLTEASDEMCPCRSCYIAHNCTRVGDWTHDYHFNPDMRCAERENHGCPSPKPSPEHIYSPHGYVCQRCGARRAKLAAPAAS
jgi:hypothetical protein